MIDFEDWFRWDGDFVPLLTSQEIALLQYYSSTVEVGQLSVTAEDPTSHHKNCSSTASHSQTASSCCLESHYELSLTSFVAMPKVSVQKKLMPL